MTKVTIEKRIHLESRFLDCDVFKHLFLKLKHITSKECSKKHGYILDIDDKIDIISQEISRANTDNIFVVRFQAEILKPMEGDRMVGIVCMLYKDGIFIIIKNRQKMLIPQIFLKEYTFNEAEGFYINDIGSKLIKEGDEIEAIVTATQYNKNNFSCFGSLA